MAFEAAIVPMRSRPRRFLLLQSIENDAQDGVGGGDFQEVRVGHIGHMNVAVAIERARRGSGNEITVGTEFLRETRKEIKVSHSLVLPLSSEATINGVVAATCVPSMIQES